MGTTLEVFFTDKFFAIPNYQRDYAWDTGNVDDLFDDILECIETQTNHYIGTFILSKTSDPKVFHVVDGQQRLTTLIMLINIAIEELGSSNESIIYGDKFIKAIEKNIWRLRLPIENHEFFVEMIERKNPTIRTRSQKLLISAYDRIKTRVSALKSDRAISSQLLETTKQLEVMEFIESDDGKAIRMFQTVNDRGRPLSNIEKAKSLLIYYSNRFLDGSLDNWVNEQFAKIFHNFAQIKSIGENYNIEVISDKRFSEDSVMRYHYLAYADDLYDYYASEDYVLDFYLKTTLKTLRSSKETVKEFITNYVSDMSRFFQGFLDIATNVPTHQKYYKLFSVLGLSTRLYPLTIRLKMRGLLNSKIESNPVLSLFDLIEIADVRVYKIRGTEPRADMSFLARDAKSIESKDIEARLLKFVNDFMWDDEFRRRLNSSIYPNAALKYMVTKYNEFLLNREYSFEELIAQSETIPTVEHIFSEEERFDFPNFGFESFQEYNDRVHMLGNLTLLEKSLNSQCHNKNPIEKASPNLYGRSIFEDPRKISAEMINRGNIFNKSHVEDRTRRLSEFCLNTWRV
jgi:uncharacterized protein with ParB-like and HNH nuclease domain